MSVKTKRPSYNVRLSVSGVSAGAEDALRTDSYSLT